MDPVEPQETDADIDVIIEKKINQQLSRSNYQMPLS
jgi:hypothetical protein